MKPSTLRAIARFVSPSIKRPSYLLLFVTSRCRAACGHCFYWRHTNRREHELSLEEIKRLARSIGPILQITITGGSPELRDDLAEIAVALGKLCSPVNMTLSSNGGEPEKLSAAVGRIVDEVPEQKLTVDISVDGLFEEHDAIRNLPGLFASVCRSYDALAAIKKRSSGLRLGMGLCVSGLNRHSAEKTARWAIDHLPIDNITPILVRGEPRNPSALGCDPDIFLKIAAMVEERLLNKRFPGYASFSSIINAKDIVQKQIIAQIARSRTFLLRCSALRETAVVYPDGSVPGCELLDEPIGNLRAVNMDISRIWQSAAAQRFRKRVASEKCFCWHQCFLSASIVKSPRLWPKLARTAWTLGGRNGAEKR